MQAYEPGCRGSGPVGNAEILGQAGLRPGQLRLGPRHDPEQAARLARRRVEPRLLRSTIASSAFSRPARPSGRERRNHPVKNVSGPQTREPLTSHEWRAIELDADRPVAFSTLLRPNQWS